jgi:hypothetical protein
MTPGVSAIITAYALMKEGALPRAGGWMDQAATYIEAMRFIAGLVGRHEKAALDG